MLAFDRGMSGIYSVKALPDVGAWRWSGKSELLWPTISSFYGALQDEDEDVWVARTVYSE